MLQTPLLRVRASASRPPPHPLPAPPPSPSTPRQASGRIRVDIEAKLSRGPVIPALRRHGESQRWHEVALSVASGNFVAAKVRRRAWWQNLLHRRNDSMST